MVVLDAGRVDQHGDEPAQRIDDHMPLPTGDFLAPVVAARSARLGGFDRLAIDDAGGRLGIPTLGGADAGMEGVVDLLPDAPASPTVVLGGDGAGSREVVGKLAPLAAGAEQ